jgi:hypothetical protein
MRLRLEFRGFRGSYKSCRNALPFYQVSMNMNAVTKFKSGAITMALGGLLNISRGIAIPTGHGKTVP